MSLAVAESPFSKMGDMTDTDTRKWAMSRLRAGDYICLSNDGETLWRFHTYVDGSFYGLIDVSYAERTFWRACYVPVEVARTLGDPVDTNPWEYPWIESDWCLPTRRAAIDRMLSATSPKPPPDPAGSTNVEPS